MNLDLLNIFTPTIPLIEIVFRGSIIYLFIFILFRVLRREAGGIGISDLILVVLIADASQNGMASEYRSVTEGIILISTIAFWDFFINWLLFHFPSLRPFLQSPPLLLIQDGKMIRKNLRSEMITHDELLSLIREQGAESINDVKRCFLEGDGKVSVITTKK